MKRFEIIMAGIGGQGLLIGGLILGYAASIHDNKYAVQVESYAPLARGGSSSSELVISDMEIDYPRVKEADMLIALSKEALNSYKKKVKPDGIILLNSTDIKEYEPDKRIIPLPITAIAKQATGKAFTVSMTALGAAAATSETISFSSILKAIEEKAPSGTAEMNITAANAGYEAATQARSV